MSILRAAREVLSTIGWLVWDTIKMFFWRGFDASLKNFRKISRQLRARG